MSIFTNPAGQAAEAASGYIAALLELLGDQDPLAVQRQLLAELEPLIADLSDDAVHRPEAPDKWSIAQVLEHLADQELVNAYRIRAITAEDEPALPGYDQDRWAARLRYGAATARQLLAELSALRTLNLRPLALLTDEEWDRVGIHSERGRESIRRLVALTAAHDLVHRRQVARIRAATGRPIT